MAEVRRPLWKSLYFQVLVAIALGVLVGWLWPDWGRALKPLGDGFIKLVKMIITPVIFLTVVTGIAGMARPEGVRPGRRSRRWPISSPSRRWRWRSAWSSPMSSSPGAGLNVDPATLDAMQGRDLRQPGARARASPASCSTSSPTPWSAPSPTGEILQVLLVAILFGIALALIGDARRAAARPAEDADRDRLPHRPHPDVRGADRRVRGDGLHHRPIRHRHARQPRRAGRHLLRDRACCSCSSCSALIARAAGFSIFGLIRYIKDELLLVLGTSSSESALPLLMEKLERGGLPQAGRRPGRPDRLFVQPRRHQHLHVAGGAVHRPGLQHPADASATSCC